MSNMASKQGGMPLTTNIACYTYYLCGFTKGRDLTDVTAIDKANKPDEPQAHTQAKAARHFFASHQNSAFTCHTDQGAAYTSCAESFVFKFSYCIIDYSSFS